MLYLRESVDGYKDNTHFSEYGAGRMADLVVEGVREHNLSLVSYLRRQVDSDEGHTRTRV